MGGGGGGLDLHWDNKKNVIQNSHLRFERTGLPFKRLFNLFLLIS